MAYPVMPVGFLGSQGDQDTYRIERSLRFNSADSAYLNRTPASSTNDKTATLSVWIKRGLLGSTYYPRIFCAGNNSSTFTSQMGIQGDCLFMNSAGLTSNYTLQSNQVLRDPSAWYHIVYVIDTANATSSERLKIYLNGVQITSFSTATYPNQNTQTHYNQSYDHSIGVSSVSRSLYYDGYIAEMYWIDGQALTPSSFGETDAVTGRWKAKAYSGTYGTNGFYLKFADNSGTTSTTLGKDSSGNGNNWTPNNFSVTAGAGNDSLVDSPTNYGTDSGVGGEVRGNYATLNALDNGGLTLANGNLDSSRATASWASIRSSVGMSSGKWYWEVTPTSGLSVGSTTNQTMIGISKQSATLGGFYQSSDGWGYYYNDGNKWNNNSGSSYGSTYTNNDVIGVAFDADNGTLVFYKNNVSQGTAFSGLTNGPYFPTHGLFGTTSSVINFGQRPFAYTAPSGFKALCTTNLPTPSIQKPSTAMDVVTYTGTGSALTPTSSLGFSPDLVWIKGRSGATDHALYDTIRGTQARLESNTTDAEVTSDNGVTSFDSAGFTLGTLAQVNTNASTYVGWAWDAGSSNVTNTAGSITSTVRADPTKGFSIVSFVNASGTNQGTVGHGLGVAPKLIIAKNRDTSANNWAVFHSSVCDTTSKFLKLNTIEATQTFSTVWGASLPTVSVFGVTGGGVAAAGVNVIAYCFSEIEGYSKFGSYTGNGSADGPFVWCGFRPRWVMVKLSSASGTNWEIYDSARNLFNPTDLLLLPSASSAEGTFGGTYPIDFTSSGFKIRGTGSGLNDSGQTLIFAAFAEAPFKYARAR